MNFVVKHVLDKTFKSIRGLRVDNRNVLCATSSRTKHFMRFSINYFALKEKQTKISKNSI